MWWLETHADCPCALLRMAADLPFAFHGLQKVFGQLGGFQSPLASQLGIGGLLGRMGGVKGCLDETA